MNFYQTEMNRIRRTLFSNEVQLETVIRIRNFIEDNFEKELNLNLLSRTQHTSKFHLLRLFKKYYGLTPKQYLISKRIAVSKSNLKKGMPFSFITLFKNKTGLTPVEFQKRATFAK
jgi:AraC-like DNA-binding protein